MTKRIVIFDFSSIYILIVVVLLTITMIDANRIAVDSHVSIFEENDIREIENDRKSMKRMFAYSSSRIIVL